jgi:hypothetical protein
MARLDTFSPKEEPKKTPPPPLPETAFPPAIEAAAARAAEQPVPEISFGETQASLPEPESVESSVKHVRVRSNVDILSELDKLRKLSTQKPTGSTGMMPAVTRDGTVRPKGSSGISIDDLLSSRLNHKRDISRSFDVGVPRDALTKSRQLTIALRFADDSGASLGPERTLAVELTSLQDIQKLLLSLKINVQAE